MIKKLRSWLREWLGVVATEININTLDIQRQHDHQKLEVDHAELKDLHNAFWAQMKMIGIDVGMKNDQTTIIFISRLGRDGAGTVRIVSAAFKNFSELHEFIQYVQRSTDPERLIIDAPYYIERELRGKTRW